MKSRLDQIEARLQAFIERSLFLLPGSQRPVRLIHQLVQVLERTIVQEANGNLTASNLFTISLHPENAAIWEANPGLLPALSRVLDEAARDAGLNLPTPPIIQLQPNPVQAIDSFTINASTRRSSLDQTGVLPIIADHEPGGADSRPRASFLIIGSQTIPLRLAVINVGRRSDNQLVVDDPRVSRTHAQLRAIHGKYTLFDLNSTGGTFINNVRISQQVVKPGDVISLAGFALIYGEESAAPDATIEDTHNQTLPDPKL